MTKENCSISVQAQAKSLIVKTFADKLGYRFLMVMTFIVKPNRQAPRHSLTTKIVKRLARHTQLRYDRTKLRTVGHRLALD